MRVVNQEANQRRGKNGHHQGFRCLIGSDKVEGKESRSDRGYARRQTIHVVEQINCVRDPD